MKTVHAETNSSKLNSILSRSPLARCCRWLFSWQGIRRMLIVLAWTVTVIALFYAEENWRGRNAWNKYRHTLEAKGEQVEFNAYIPKPILDDQNFASIPFVRSWFERNASGEFKDPYSADNFARANSLITSAKGNEFRRRWHYLDLVAWETAFADVRPGRPDSQPRLEPQDRDLESRAKAAPGVLENLKADEPIFAELRSACSRPLAVYPVKYDIDCPVAIFLPHLARIKGTCQRLELKACAELAAGQSDAALADVELICFLADSLKQEPFLISYLVRIADCQIAMHVVWEGLAEHRWTDSQLQTLITRLRQTDFLSDLQMPLRAERAASLSTIDYVRRTGGFRQLSSSSDDVIASDLAGMLFQQVAPRGWVDQEKLNYCLIAQMYLRSGFDPAAKLISPVQIQANAQDVQSILENTSHGPLSRLFHHQAAVSMLLPAFDGMMRKSAIGQTVVNQAVIACALERYRLANGQLPEQLQTLAPKFISQLPDDVLTGKPYRYRRTIEDRFVLHSVGWNTKDDGGVPGRVPFDDKEGDWVWEYPAK